MAELQRRGTLVLVIDVEDDPGILNDGNLRKIDAGKSVKALGALFLRPGAGDDFPTENDIDFVGPVMGSETETVQEIGPVSYTHLVEIEKLKITDYERNKPIKIIWEKAGSRYSVTNNYIKFPEVDSPSRDELFRMNAYIDVYKRQEYDCLLMFVRHKNKALTREQLLKALWLSLIHI